MAIQSTVIQNADGSWTFTWAAGTSPYQVWLDGVLLLSNITDLTYTYALAGYESTPPPIEILNDGDAIENSLYSPILLLQWRGLVNAKAYSIERYVSGVWVPSGTASENGSGYYQFQTPALTEASEAQWRVTAVDQYGNTGTPLTFTKVIVRNPAPPAVDISYSSTGDVVVTGA